jgi:hypothetical protein
MSRNIVFAGLATLTLIASSAPTVAQGSVGVGFKDYGYGGRYGDSWGRGPYSSGPAAWPWRYQSARAILRGHYSGFYLVGSRYTGDPYRASASTGFGWPDNDWRSRLPMH